jgi:Ca2+/H+ antiporter
MSLTQEAKKHGPKGYIVGGAFFIVVGVIIAVHVLLDPERVSVRGTPFRVLSVLLLIGGLPLLIAGIRARRDLTK